MYTVQGHLCLDNWISKTSPLQNMLAPCFGSLKALCLDFLFCWLLYPSDSILAPFSEESATYEKIPLATSVKGWHMGRTRGGYSPPLEHTSLPLEVEKLYFRDFWHVKYPQNYSNLAPLFQRASPPLENSWSHPCPCMAYINKVAKSTKVFLL